VSTIKVDTVQSTGGGAVTLTKQEGAKARALHRDQVLQSGSLNHTSLTDNGTGDFQTTRTNNMSSTHYSAVGACGRAGFSYVGGDCEIPSNAFPTTALIKFYSYTHGASLGDVQYISGQLDGDLA